MLLGEKTRIWDVSYYTGGGEKGSKKKLLNKKNEKLEKTAGVVHTSKTWVGKKKCHSPFNKDL